jgi:hypothetical protein
MGLFEWFGGVGTAVGRTVGGAATWANQQGARVGSLIPRRSYASSVPAPAPIRSYTPLPSQQFGTRYSPRTLSARVANAGVTLQLRRTPQRAALVPNRFNLQGQQVYRKAQTSQRVGPRPEFQRPTDPLMATVRAAENVRINREWERTKQRIASSERRSPQERTGNGITAAQTKRVDAFLGRRL